MTRPTLELNDLQIILSSGPHSAELGDLVWAMGDPASARELYEAAWRAGDDGALVTLVALDHVSHIPNTSAPLMARAQSIVEAATAGRIDRLTAVELLRFLGQLSAFRLHDYDEATRLTVWAARHFDVDPILFSGLDGAQLPTEAWQECLEGVLRRASTSPGPTERNRLLLLAAMLGAELGLTDLGWYERLIRVARGELNEVFLFFLLRLLDRVDTDPSELSRSDLQLYIGPLAERIGDPEERFAYRLRQLDLVAQAGGAPRALEGLRTLANGPHVDGRAAAQERCQRMAVCSGMPEVAADMALVRARRTADPQLKYALWLQAEELHRLAQSGPTKLLEVLRDLANFARRSGKAAPGVLEHAFQVIEAAAIQANMDDQLLSLWDEREMVAIMGDQSLRRILYRRPKEDLVPESADVGALVSRIHPRLSRIATRSILSLAFVGDGWSVVASDIRPERFHETERRHAKRLKGYCLLFHRQESAAALKVFDELLSGGDHSPLTLWGLWFAASKEGALSAWSTRFAECAAAATKPDVAFLFRSLEAAAQADAHGPERGLELAQKILEQQPEDLAASIIVKRLSDFEEVPKPLDLDSIVTVRTRLAQHPELDELVEKAETEIRKGNPNEAAIILEDAAVKTSDKSPTLAAALLVRAGGVLGSALNDAAGAEQYLRRALELEPNHTLAWQALCGVLSRTGQYGQVAELVEQRPNDLPAREIPYEDLRRSSRALAADDPDAAANILSLLVSSAGARQVDEALRRDLKELFELSRRTQRIGPYRDLIEGMVVEAQSGVLRGELNYRLGVVYGEEMRDVDLAVEHLRRALNAPDTRELAGRRLRPLLEQQERWEELVEVLLTIAEFAHDDVERVSILMSAAEILWDRLNRPSAAAEALELLLHHDPKQLPAMLRLAEYHYQTEEWERAVVLLERAAKQVEDKGERAHVYQRLGEIYQMHIEKPNQALENYLVSFMCNSANRETFDRLDRLYTATGRFQELVAILNIAIQTVRNNPDQPDEAPYDLEEIFARRAHIEFKQLDAPREAAESLLEALRINPHNELYLKLLEGHLLDDAKPDTILAAYELRAEALPTDSHDLPDLIRAQAAVCERLPDCRDKAFNYYARLHELDPSDKSAFGKLEAHFREQQRWDDLIELYWRQLEWVNRPEQTVALHHKIARIYESERRDMPAAAETYVRLLKVAPASISALRGLGRLYEAMRRWDDLIDISEREVKLVDDDRVKAHLLFKIGSIYETHRGDEDKAVGYYERSVAHDARCVPALHGLRDIYQRRGEPAKMIEYLQREADIWDNPRERASIHTRIAQVYWEGQQDGDKAIEHLQLGLGMVPDSAPALHLLLDIYFSQQSWGDAAPIAYSLSQHPESIKTERRGELFLQRGVIAHHLGNRREAIESLKIALDIAPDNADAFELLTTILNEKGDSDSHAEFFKRLQREYGNLSQPAGLARVNRFLGRQAEDRRDLREAVRLYSEAIELDRDSVAGLQDLVRVFVRVRSFDEALARATAFAESASAVEAKLAARVIGARVMIDHLNQRAEAREVLDEVLKENPSERNALFLAAQAAYLDADWEAARKAITALVRLDIQQRDDLDRVERAEHLFYQGRILEVGFDLLDDAQNAYARAREEYPIDPRPLKAAALILFRQEHWHRLDGLLDRALRGAEASGGQSAMIPILMLAAKLSQLRDQGDKAQDYLRRLLEVDPSHTEARRLMVEVVGEGRGEGDALKELQELLDSNVFDANALHGLATLHSSLGDSARAALFWRILELIDADRAAGGKNDLSSHPSLPTGGMFEQEIVDRYVYPPILRSGYHRALVKIAPAFPSLGLARTPELPSRSRRLDDDEAAALRQVLADVIEARTPATGSVELYREGPQGISVTAMVDDGPKVVLEVPTDLLNEAERCEAQFILGHAVELLAAGTFAVLAAPRTDLTHVLWWLARWAQAPDGTPPIEDAPWATQLDFPLVDDLRELMLAHGDLFEPLADPQHAERVVIELEHATTLVADRMGLLLCNDLKAAVSAILKIETGAGFEMVRDAAADLARSKRVTQLIRYAMSNEYFDLWQSLGGGQ